MVTDPDPARVQNLVERAIADGLTPEQVCAAEGGDVGVLVAVRRLWAQCQRNAAVLDELFAGRPPPPDGPWEGPGTRVGPYTLVRPIGEGGFGVVFLAEPAGPVRRPVAVKIIKPGMNSRAVLARFEAERQALARMDHPNIAKVFDGGTTAAGRPYFVMELVDGGRPITAHADAAGLTVADRVALMVPVCRAVHSAHRKGVIHRDLKPTNVLVAAAAAGDDGAAAVPKVIDFGVAKATGEAGSTSLTLAGSVVGTPAYMSPEQAAGTGPGADVDTRADVYALGVLLYELLTGTVPVDPAAPTGGADPVRPSARLAADPDGRRRQSARAVRGDLDWVVLRAIERDRDRRYDSAADLVDDLERYLSGEPVTAGPPGRLYRAGRFVRRYRAPLAAAAAVMVTLVLGVVGTSVGLVHEARQRRVAQAERQTAEAERRVAEARRAEADAQRRAAEAVVTFLTRDVLTKASPRHATTNPALGDGVVRVMIQPSLRAADHQFADQPLVRATVQTALATVLVDLGRYDLAVPPAQSAWTCRQAALGPDDPRTAEAQDVYLTSLASSGRQAEAAALLPQVLDRRRRTLGPDHPATIEAMQLDAVSLQSAGQYDQALALAREAYDRSRRTLGDADLRTVRAAAGYGWALRGVGRAADAVPVAADVWARRRRLLGDAHPDTLRALDDYARTLVDAGRAAEACPLAERAWRTARRTLGDRHPDTAWHQLGYGMALLAAHRPADAEPVLHAAWDLNRSTLGPDHWVTVKAELCYAMAVDAGGRPAEAEPLLRAAWAWHRRAYGDDHPETVQVLQTYAGSLAEQGRPAEAEAAFADAVAADRRAGRSGRPEFANLLAAQTRRLQLDHREAPTTASAVAGQAGPSTTPAGTDRPIAASARDGAQRSVR